MLKCNEDLSLDERMEIMDLLVATIALFVAWLATPILVGVGVWIHIRLTIQETERPALIWRQYPAPATWRDRVGTLAVVGGCAAGIAILWSVGGPAWAAITTHFGSNTMAANDHGGLMFLPALATFVAVCITLLTLAAHISTEITSNNRRH